MLSLLNAQFPEWFLSPSKYDGYIIGFSRGETLPLIDAQIMSCWYDKVILKGDLYYYTDSKNEGIVSDYYWWYDSKCVEKVKDNLVRLDHFTTNIFLGSKVALFSKEKELLEPIPFQILNIDDIPQPDWINKGNWENEGFYYSVGMFTSLFERNDGWKTAEERAFLNMVSSIISDVKSISYYEQKDRQRLVDEYEEVIKNSFHCEIKNATVMERWFHKENNLFYVLVRAAKENLLYPEINKLNGSEK